MLQLLRVEESNQIQTQGPRDRPQKFSGSRNGRTPVRHAGGAIGGKSAEEERIGEAERTDGEDG
jgi:hypothetical protein